MIDRDQSVLAYDPFAGDETRITVLSDTIVVTRTAHLCNVCQGQTVPGTRCRRRTEINHDDRKLMSFYFCTPCCDAMAASWEDEGRAIEERTRIGMEKADA